MDRRDSPFNRSFCCVASLAASLSVSCADGDPASEERDLGDSDMSEHDHYGDYGANDEPGLAQAALANTWTFCSNEFATCRFAGLRDVRLIAPDGRNVVREFFQEASCSPAAFEFDPAPTISKYCESGPQKFQTLPAPLMNMGPPIDLTKIPLGFPGYSVARVRPNPETPVPDTIGAFRTVCSLSHMNFDDPIVYPGTPGASHLHAFFGNTGSNYASTAGSLATTGNSTCRGGIVNRSAYWVPALIDTRTGVPVMPYEAHFYYKTGYAGIAPSAVQPMPKGLRMIAGSPGASGPQEYVDWGCLQVSMTGSSVQNCPGGTQLQMSVTFPQCWDGRNLDSTDHKSHMAYPRNGACPPTHPVPIPVISFHIRYNVPDANAPLFWRLSSDMYDASLPGGYSAHADWFDGWRDDIKNTWVRNCDNRSVDCHSNLLGDGREIF